LLKSAKIAVFRAVNNRHQIATEHSVSRIVKKAMRDLTRRRDKTPAEAKDMVPGTRSGPATRPAPARPTWPALRIQQHTRYKSADMVARYVRKSDKWSRSGLKSVLRPGHMTFRFSGAADKRGNASRSLGR
jgi:hypothetical protein